MIISLRGTNGSGKSTIVKTILDSYPTVRAFMMPKKKKPAGYVCELDTRRLFIPGHYEIQNGGIDTIGDLRNVYDYICSFHGYGCDVLYEGMNLSDGLKYLLTMSQVGIDTRVIFIDHPLEDCIKSVRLRGHKIKESTISAIYKNCNRQYLKLTSETVPCYKLDRVAALNQIQKWLGLEHENRSGAERMSAIAADHSASARTWQTRK